MNIKLRLISTVVGMSMLLSLASCSQNETINTDETETQTEVINTEETILETSLEPEEDSYNISSEMKEKFEEYVSIVNSDSYPSGYYPEYYVEDYKASIDVLDNVDGMLTFLYAIPNTRSSIQMDYSPYFSTGSLNFICDLTYSDGYEVMMSTNTMSSVSRMEDIIENLDTLIETDDYRVYVEGTNLSDSPVMDDAKTLYSRFIYMVIDVLAQEGFTPEEIGMDLGSLYKELDPHASLSFVNEIEFESHTFTDGICDDCGKYWFTCLGNNVIAMNDGDYDGGYWTAVYLPRNPNFIKPDDGLNVEYYVDDDYIDIYYYSMDDNLLYEFSLGGSKTTPDVISFNFSYGGRYVEIEEAGEDVPGVVELVDSTDIYGYGSAEEVTELLFNPDFAKFICFYNNEYIESDEVSQEVIDAYMTLIPQILEAMDFGLESLDMSLSDAGIVK